MKIRKTKGFTLIELMLVMVIAAVMASLKMQDDNLEMTQLQARKLGVNELFVYNLGVQKHVSGLSGQVPAPGDYPKVYVGVDWLKNTTCAGGSGTAPSDFVPCPFLNNTGGRTTLGGMSFTTTINYDAASGYTARTVMSQMAGTGAGESNSGVLGMAALVASGVLAGSDGGASVGGSITYCPDITPMPAGMVPVCGVSRDRIVMIVNANGRTDQWLRVDHGNIMQHAIEMSDNPAATPATDADLQAMHPNMRQLRNVARVYNLGASGNENLYIGSRLGAIAEVGEVGSPTTLASNAVIIDADQEILGQLLVQGTIGASGDISSGGQVTADGDVITANGNLVAQTGNASINGWIQATNGNITASNGDFIADRGDFLARLGDVRVDNGDIVANNGELRTSRFVDSDNTGYYVNPSATSNINALNVRGRLNMLGSAYVGITSSPGAGCSPNGALARTSAGEMMSCVSGRWKVPGGGGIQHVSKYSTYHYETTRGTSAAAACRPPAGMSYYTRIWVDSGYGGRDGHDSDFWLCFYK